MAARNDLQPVEFTPKQLAFLSSAARFLLFGGGAGGGKTFVAIWDMLGLNNPGNGKRAIDFPEYTGLFLRRSLGELRDIIRRSEGIYPHFGGKFMKGEKVWVFPSGARIFFGYVERDEDVMRYQGWEYQQICFEELGQWPTSYPFTFLHTRLRKLENSPIRIGMRATCNPGGPGHQWIRSFWQIPDDGAPTRFDIPMRVEVNGREETVVFGRQFIPSLLDDNPYLSQAEYAANLGGDEISENMRNALRWGRWDIIDLRGRIYNKELQSLRANGHIREIPYDPRYPVNTIWDLGVTDHIAIWFHQRVEEQDRFIDYHEDQHVGLKEHWRVLQEKPYVYGAHLLPHDADQVRHSTGGVVTTVTKILEDLGMRNIEVVPRVSLIRDGIEATRIVLPRCFFDKEKTQRGIECLENYRFPVTASGAVGQRPVHDEFSHGADAMRGFGQGHSLLDMDYQAIQQALVSATPRGYERTKRPERRRKKKWRV